MARPVAPESVCSRALRFLQGHPGRQLVGEVGQAVGAGRKAISVAMVRLRRKGLARSCGFGWIEAVNQEGART